MVKIGVQGDRKRRDRKKGEREGHRGRSFRIGLRLFPSHGLRPKMTWIPQRGGEKVDFLLSQH